MAEIHDRQVKRIKMKIQSLEQSLKFYKKELEFWINHPERKGNE